MKGETTGILSPETKYCSNGYCEGLRKVGEKRNYSEINTFMILLKYNQKQVSTPDNDQTH